VRGMAANRRLARSIMDVRKSRVKRASRKQEEKPVVLEAASHVLRNQQRFQNGESQLPTTPEYAAIGFVGLGRNDR